MFKGSGLEINFVLADPRLIFCRPPVVSADAAGLAPSTIRTTDDNYSISNIFLSLVYHQSINPRFGMMS